MVAYRFRCLRAHIWPMAGLVTGEIGFYLGVIPHRAGARETLAGVNPDPHGFTWSA
jgi:hypothetical protein